MKQKKRKAQSEQSLEPLSITSDEINKLIEHNHWKKIEIDDEKRTNLEGFLELEELDLTSYFSGLKTSKKNTEVKQSIKRKDSTSEREDKTINHQNKHYSLNSVETFWENIEDLKISMKEWIFSEECPIHPVFLTALKNSNFNTPMPIQKACFLPAYRDRKDIIGVAETGSGKTLAFSIPILCSILSSHLKFNEKNNENLSDQNFKTNSDLRALIVLPSRELSLQVHKHLKAISQYTPIQSICLIGGIYYKKHLRLLGNNPEIVIGTPGRLSALMLGSTSMGIEPHKYLCNLSLLRHLVIDEADRLFIEGDFSDLTKMMGYIYKQIPNPDQLQTFIFSATLSVPQRTLHNQSMRKQLKSRNSISILIQKLNLRLKKTFVVDFTSNSNSVKLTNQENPPLDSNIESKTHILDKQLKLPDGLSINLIKCQAADKELELIAFLYWYFHYSTEAKAIIFVNSVSYVYRLVPILSLLFDQDKHNIHLPKKLQLSTSSSHHRNTKITGIHSSITQKQRLKNLEKFLKFPRSILVCTDIAARGLDLPNVNAIIHLQLPRNASIFVHRSGRTARAQRQGICVNLVVPKEYSSWSKMLQIIGINISELSPPEGYESTSKNFISKVKQRLKLAIEIEQAEHLMTKEKKNKSWITKFANEGDMDLSSSEDETEDGYTKADSKRRLLQKKKEIINVSSFGEIILIGTQFNQNFSSTF